MSITNSPPRLSNWEERLNAYLGQHHDRDDVGDYECAFFAAGAVEAQTGKDFSAGFGRDLATAEDVQDQLAKAGVPNLAALVETMLPRTPRSTARRGDIVMTRDGNLAVAWGEVALALGLPNLPGHEPMAGNGVVVRVPRKLWRKAWRVG